MENKQAKQKNQMFMCLSTAEVALTILDISNGMQSVKKSLGAYNILYWIMAAKGWIENIYSSTIHTLK